MFPASVVWDLLIAAPAISAGFAASTELRGTEPSIKARVPGREDSGRSLVVNTCGTVRTLYPGATLRLQQARLNLEHMVPVSEPCTELWFDPSSWH